MLSSTVLRASRRRVAATVAALATLVLALAAAPATAATAAPAGAATAATASPDVPATFTVKGAGYGHGVGMPQYGAQAMAVAGRGALTILRKYYTGTNVAWVDAGKDLRVGIFGSGSDARGAVDVVATGPWRLRFVDGRSTPHTTWTGAAGEVLHVTRTGTSVKVTRQSGKSAVATGRVRVEWAGTRYYRSGSSAATTVSLRKAGRKVSATHGTYRHGRLVISVPAAGSPQRLTVVNQLRLNSEYLYGIAEMPSSWHTSALRAQAIVARGYALRAVDAGIKADCDCHLYDDTRSQNFTGWRKESEGTGAYYGKRWVAAVDRTRDGSSGRVVRYKGAIAQTFYFSSSGGQTENSEDIWTSEVPYLRSVDDPWSLKTTISNPWRAWSQTLTQAQASAAFGLPDVVSIAITARTDGGSDAAVTRVRATSSTGATSVLTGAETIRSRLAAGTSPWIHRFVANS
ncbi:SpoIID/LytB domain-containing protein [Demequina phytophila]|uniref:SpoIID/LytB domain-containing protein n=1 Tax=Demequina phytophila TaxID=1638981 RepID=UPI00078355DB|nr:SpoIID/LytB domain-containing protein [Demequina phytophila]